MAGGTSKRNAAAAPLTVGDITSYLAQEPVDFRLGIDGLSVLVEARLRFDPFSRNLFYFVKKRRNQIKVLCWQRSGFCWCLKRLEEEKSEEQISLQTARIAILEEQPRLATVQRFAPKSEKLASLGDLAVAPRAYGRDDRAGS